MTSELRPGTRCGDYELLAFIGKGGMAQVWSARNTRNGELVAVKTLLPVYAADPVLQERLAREGDSQSALRHPNILRAYGTFRLNDSIFMVMDLVDGESLERYLLRRHGIPVPEIRGIAQAVLSALQHAHDSHIVHRDVKPSNVLLSRSGQILLSDFGIALLRNAVRLTRIGGIGTPSYMSPEQIVGRDITHQSDIYAVGCVLYELLTGLPPFYAEGPSANEIVREAHQFKTPEPFLANHPEIPPALESAVLRALEKKPADRFLSCAEFAAALGVSIQRQTPGGPARSAEPVTQPVHVRGSASDQYGAIEVPQAGTPGESRAVRRPSGPRVMPTPGARVSSRVAKDSGQIGPGRGAVHGLPETGPGVTTARPSRPSGHGTAAGRALTPAVAVITRHSGLTGAIAITGAVILAASAIARWQVTHPSQQSASTHAVSPASSTGAPSATGNATASALTAGKTPTADPATGKADAGLDAANPAAVGRPVDSIQVSNAIEQLKHTYDRLQNDSASTAPAPDAATGGSALPKRPAPLSPPPGALAHTSGVLQWTGIRGDTVEIMGASVNKGAVTGDALPGVPVRITVENEDGTVLQLPSDADGFRKLTLHMATGHARIHWQVVGTGPTK